MGKQRHQILGKRASATGMIRLASGCIWVGVACVLAGCVGQRMEIVAARCEPVQGRSGIEAVGFDAQIAAQGHSGEQFVYRVDLYDAYGSPVQSVNRRFRNASGGVGASRTFVPLDGAPPVQIMRVTIPVSEMELAAEKPPAQALFGLYQIDGVCLARQTVALPQIGQGMPAPGEALAAVSPQHDKSSAAPAVQADGMADGTADDEPNVLATPISNPDPDRKPDPIPASESKSDSTESPRDAVAADLESKASERDSAEVAEPEDDEHVFPDADRLASASQEPLQESSRESSGAVSQGSSDDAHESVGSASDVPVDPMRPAVTTTDQSTDSDRTIEGTPPIDGVRPVEAARVHVIEAGDSMRSISLKYYGVHDGIDHILQANPEFNPRRARIGHRLNIPPFAGAAQMNEDRADKEADRSGAPNTGVAAQPPADTSHLQRYIVRRGDTLTGIARRFLGDALRWREVYDMNQTVIQDADELRIGMVLIIPDR